MITKDDIKPGFKFKTTHSFYVIDHVKNDIVYLRQLNKEPIKTFGWATVENAILSLNNDPSFQVLSPIPNFKYIEEL